MCVKQSRKTPRPKREEKSFGNVKEKSQQIKSKKITQINKKYNQHSEITGRNFLILDLWKSF